MASVVTRIDIFLDAVVFFRKTVEQNQPTQPQDCLPIDADGGASAVRNAETAVGDAERSLRVLQDATRLLELKTSASTQSSWRAS